MKVFLLAVTSLLLYSVPALTSNGVLDRRCFIFPHYLKPYVGPPKTVTYVSTAGEAELRAETKNSRLMNGTVMVVSTPEGEKTVMVLSDYLLEHRRHPGTLPRGWKLVRYVHRGEFQVRDGFVIRGNETSGSAFESGQAEQNKVANVMTYLDGTPLANETTQFDSYEKAHEHYYPGFDEPGGTPSGLHKKRDRFLKATDTVTSILNLKFYDIMVGDKEMIPEILEHWELYTQGLTPAEREKVAPLKVGLLKTQGGAKLTDEDAAPMLAAFKLLEAKKNRTFIFEVK